MLFELYRLHPSERERRVSGRVQTSDENGQDGDQVDVDDACPAPDPTSLVVAPSNDVLRRDDPHAQTTAPVDVRVRTSSR
ncbi:MAG: hypothetical protein ACLP01_24465 [Solirubrobacteraceae bacterium]